MKFKLFVVFLLSAGIISCKSKSAFKYSEKLVEIERSMSPEIASTEEKFGQFITDEKYDSGYAISQRMEELADTKLKEVERLEPPDVKEAAAFKKTALRYFGYIKGLYTHYKSYAKNAAGEGREKELASLQKFLNDRNDILSEMKDAQIRFAKANGFRLDESK
jgi:hypothetical protein